MQGASGTIRILGPGDEATLETFLRERAASSMFLRSNLRAGGIEDRGAVHQARYAALIGDDEIAAVAAHCWNGSLVLQAPIAPERVAAAAVAASGRKVRWLLGPASQVDAVRRSPLLSGRVPVKTSLEELMQLRLERLSVPPVLAGARVLCRHAKPGDFDRLVEWRGAYEAEAFGRTVTATILREARAELERLSASRSLFVLEAGSGPVAMCGFNARLPDCVQLGGVFTPPSLRGRGYGRAATAGALLAAGREGVTDGVLFTGIENAPALRAYRSLGFERVGDYALVLYEA